MNSTPWTASTLARCRVYLDPRDVGAPGGTVSAAGHEIEVADLVHATQVRHCDGRLAIHRSYVGEDCTKFQPSYMVTNIPTGYGVMRFSTISDAKAFVRCIAKLDWNYTDPSQRSPDFKRNVDRIYDRVIRRQHELKARVSE